MDYQKKPLGTFQKGTVARSGIGHQRLGSASTAPVNYQFGIAVFCAVFPMKYLPAVYFNSYSMLAIFSFKSIIYDYG